MNEAASSNQHLYDAVSTQRDRVVEGFGEQREALRRAVADQRLAAMPEGLRRAAMGPSAQASAEIVEILQKIIAREVTRQLDMAICTMIERTARPQTEHTADIS